MPAGLACADGRVNYLSSFINSGIHKNKSFQRVKTLEAVRVGVGDAELVAAEQVTTLRLQPTGLAGCVSALIIATALGVGVSRSR